MRAATSYFHFSSSSLLTTSSRPQNSKERIMAKPSILKARYKTLCKKCFQTIFAGETIRVYDDKWYHNKCSHRLERETNKKKELVQ